MKKILGLDLGTNSIGWALVEQDENGKVARVIKMGSRIIPMDDAAMSDFNKGALKSQTSVRTDFRGHRRLHERHLLRRERLHRVLNILGFLPEHYTKSIDFEKHVGQFKDGNEPKLVYAINPDTGMNEFIFKNSFNEMVEEFKQTQPHLFENDRKIPYDWTIYYLRKKALTQKIEKEELAWLLLNFNQKRGYFQLRGEDADEIMTKREEFYSLKVVDVYADPEQKGKKDETWYKVVLENGWIYPRKSNTPLDWVGKTRDFIVTTELDDNGNIKRGKDGLEKRSFRAPADDDWTLLKKKTEADVLQSHKTVGSYIYDRLLANPTQKINGKLVRTIERHFYKKELTQILERQQQEHPELNNTDLYRASLDELYHYNEDHKKNIATKDFAHLFLNDIIFYQRPLKSKKSLISNCPYESHSYIKEKGGIPETVFLKCIAKSNPLFQEFRLWQFIQNLKIYAREQVVDGRLKTDVDVTGNYLKSEADYVALFDWLNNCDIITQNTLLSFILKTKKNVSELNHRWNYVEDKEYPCNRTRHAILKCLGKDVKIALTQSDEMKIWHLLYSINTKAEIDHALNPNAARTNRKAKATQFEMIAYLQQLGFDDDAIAQLKKTKFKEEDYGSYSEKAIKKLLPLLRMGKYWDESQIHPHTKDRIDKIITGEYDETIRNRVREKSLSITDISNCRNLPLWLACYIVYDRHSEASDLKQWKVPADIESFLKNEFKQHSLRNPVVEQVITETLRVVADVWKYYGNSESQFFKEIHIELGREMKNPADARKKMTESNSANENTNLRIKALLQEMMNDTEYEDVRPYSPSQQEILKIYEDGVLSKYSDAALKNETEGDVEIFKVSKSGSPTKREIEKYKLWLEQKYCSPYTGEMIPLSKLFTPAYQIEHVIPQSRYFDDSFSNKVICEAEVNKDKDNATAYQYIKNNHGKIIELSYGKKVTIYEVAEYEQHVKETYANNRGKMKKLLMEDVPDDFINRQLNDSRYISKEIKSLLSNIVREDNEQEATSKHVLSTNGAITSTLKQDWGLNDVWNTLITPRFERMNALTSSNAFGQWTDKDGKNVFQTDMPLELQNGFTKKRIDHRHHALDALIIACATRNHINYLNNESAKAKNAGTRHELKNLLCEKKYNGDNNKNYKWIFKKPWETFTQDTLDALLTTVVSFKQNTRIINKTVNKYQSWKDESGNVRLDKNGNPLKDMTKQVKGDSWAIRKPLHAPLPYGRKEYDFAVLKICENVGKRDHILDPEIKNEVIRVFNENNGKVGLTEKALKGKPIKDNNGEDILVTVFDTNEIRYRKRQPIYKLANRGQGGFKDAKQAIAFINKVSDKILRHDLLTHLKQNENDIDKAFSTDGIDAFNASRQIPVYRLPISESSELKFPLGTKHNTKHKYGEAESGTNLFFAVYWDADNRKRTYDTIPLNIVIEHQKQVANLPKEQRTPVPLNHEKGHFLFALSPGELVYVPTTEEMVNPRLVDFKHLTMEQAGRVYKMVSSTGTECYFILSTTSSLVKGYDAKSKVGEYGSMNKMEKTIDGITIKDRCWKLQVDRLGNVVSATILTH